MMRTQKINKRKNNNNNKQGACVKKTIWQVRKDELKTGIKNTEATVTSYCQLHLVHKNEYKS